MFKKIILIFTFSFFLFYQPAIIFSETNDSISIENQENQTIWDIITSIWNSIFSFIKNLTGTSTVKEITNTPSEDTSKTNTDYNDSTKDYTLRTLPESERKYQIGVWFNEVLQGNKGYKNEIISQATDTCPEIKITDIIYFYYTQNQKILYDRSDYQNPIEYNSGLINQHITSLGDNHCYINTYNGISSAPKGTFGGKEDASLYSTQLNRTTRIATSDKSQGENAPDNLDNADNIKKTVEDNDKQDENLYKNIITASDQKKITCNGSKRNSERQIFSDSLTDADWQKSTNDNTPPHRSDANGSNASNCAQSGHGRGMSQYGAYGMALTGYGYQTILISYYGDISLGQINSSTDKITVKLVNKESGSPCSNLVANFSNRFQLNGNIFTLTIEDYLKGLAEIPTNWSLEAHKAQTIAARTYAYNRTNNLSKSIKNSSVDQVFRCKRLLDNLKTSNNQTKAVDQTSGIVITKNGNVFSTEYSSCHGQPSKTPPYFDGTYYERIANAPVYANDGICEAITFTQTQDITATINNDGTYTFNGTKHQNTIAENYDISTIDNGTWLKTYQDNCQLDSRVFPALNFLITAVNNNFPNEHLKFLSCYRNISEENILWNAAIKKYGSESEASKYATLPGTSSHQTGRVIDFKDANGKLTQSSSLYLWLTQNAATYGFYNNSSLEPEHWEYNP